jgi:hypothetical protein
MSSADLVTIIRDLRGMAKAIRADAQEHAHAMKSAVATIKMSLGAIRRTLAVTDGPAARARTDRPLHRQAHRLPVEV